MKIYVQGLLLLVLSVPVFLQAETPSKMISNQEVHQQIVSKTAPTILDVRSEQEYQEGHIAGSRNIPHTQLESRLTELSADKNKPLYVYCHSGRRAGKAETVLKRAGFTHVVHIDGDMQGWKAAGLPVER